MIDNRWAYRSGEAMQSPSSVARLFVICLVLTIVGCVSQSVDAERVKSINQIALVPPENPVHYGLAVGDVWLAITLGAVVGPGATAGELAGSSVTSGRATALDQALASQPLMLGDELGRAVEEALKQDGYDVAQPSVKRGSRADILSDLRSSAPDADAALILTIDKNTYERRVWGKIGPHLVVTARLTDASSGRQLFTQDLRLRFLFCNDRLRDCPTGRQVRI